MVIYHSRDTSLRAFALTHAGASPSCNHRCPRCRDTRGTTPRPSRSSSRAGSRSGSPTANTNSLRGFVGRMVDETLKHDQDALTERENIWRAHGMPEESNNLNPCGVFFTLFLRRERWASTVGTVKGTTVARGVFCRL